MITVEKAIRDNKTRKAVEENPTKKPIVKKILIGVAILAVVYFGYKMMKGKNETIQPNNP